MDLLIITSSIILSIVGYMYLKDKFHEDSKIPFDNERFKIV
jgi:hypothetical protein